MAASLCALLLGACPEDEEPIVEEDAGDTPHSVQPCPDGTPETAIGMKVVGRSETLRAELVEADDLPAIKGYNTWTVQILDAEDEPVTDAELELDRGFGFMPAHLHDTNHDPVVESLGDGRFEISEINLHMDGYWELTLAPTSASAGDDEMTFTLCTEASIAAAHGGAEH
jgi:hypothetical protein